MAHNLAIDRLKTIVEFQERVVGYIEMEELKEARKPRGSMPTRRSTVMMASRTRG